MEKLNQILREEGSSLLKKKDKSDSILKAKYTAGPRGKSNKNPNKSKLACFKCGQKGNFAVKCTGEGVKKCCKMCEKPSHTTQDCWKNKGMNSDSTNAVSV